MPSDAVGTSNLIGATSMWVGAENSSAAEQGSDTLGPLLPSGEVEP